MTGVLLIISAPSGAGKTSLVKALREADERVQVSVSHTTRAMRPGEQDGRDYFFVDRATFVAMAEAKEFLESAEVFGNLYGTSAQAVRTQLNEGRDVILEIDWQGAAQVRERFADAVSIFVLPPSRDTLNRRLKTRGQDAPDVIQARMARAIGEMSHFDAYDYLIVNDDFATALGELQHIVLAERLRVERRTAALQDLLSELLSE